LLKVLIGFNDCEYQAIDLSEWIKGNPADVLKANFACDDETVAAMQRATTFMTPPQAK
jgi:oxalate decarboxylase